MFFILSVFCARSSSMFYSGACIRSTRWSDQSHTDIIAASQMTWWCSLLRWSEFSTREPLTACRRKDNPKLCKGDFPRTLWLIEKAVVLCQGLINRMVMALTRRKSKFGALQVSMNQESQNATSSAMLVLHRCNSDVLLPCRFPITAETHNDVHCGEAFVSSLDPNVILQAAQSS